MLNGEIEYLGQVSHTQPRDIVKAHVPHVYTTPFLTDIQLACYEDKQTQF
jgi:hypothetical protein